MADKKEQCKDRKVLWRKRSRGGNNWVLCNAHGEQITNTMGDLMSITEMEAIEQWLGDCVEVREWKPQRPYEEVAAILKKAYDDAEKGRISGYEASLIKWKTLIEWVEETGQKPPCGDSGTQVEYYNGCCGLCVQYGNCKSCPLLNEWRKCCNHPTWPKDSLDPAAWLDHAKRFLAFIIERCEERKQAIEAIAKKSPADEWIYAVWPLNEEKHGNFVAKYPGG